MDTQGTPPPAFRRVPLFMKLDGEWGLGFGDDLQFCDGHRPSTPEDETLEALADMLDDDAENRNCHDFIGAHQALAILLFQEVGRDAATSVMRRLANYFGLHGMNGRGSGDSLDLVEQELNIPLGGGTPWFLPDRNPTTPQNEHPDQ